MSNDTPADAILVLQDVKAMSSHSDALHMATDSHQAQQEVVGAGPVRVHRRRWTRLHPWLRANALHPGTRPTVVVITGHDPHDRGDDAGSLRPNVANSLRSAVACP